ncbi:MAG: iron uptake porin [Synechococcales cyanobacterium RM1_1_8]|nr:iron uptake porin [Synechococcales cyanobacterium RM1_1_8]
MKNATAQLALAALLTLGANIGLVSFSSPAMAQPAQSVSDLRDVSPNDWAYTAVQNMVERYGCLAGYPDGTFKGNRSMTRFEFAAALNSCIDTITAQIQENTVQVTANDLVLMQRLQEEFRSELSTLRARVDGLEERTAELEKIAPRLSSAAT